MKAAIKNFINDIRRYWWARKRNALTKNNLINSKYKADDFVIRDAVIDDLPALIALHVQVWNETHWNVKRKPTYETRESQWRKQFTQPTDNWFCLVVESPDKQLVGFAKGEIEKLDNLPEYNGFLSKFYFLLPYQRLGLGKRLFRGVAEHFISMGINSMVLFGVGYNPSCYFYQRMGGKRLYTKNGEFHGAFGWLDLGAVAKQHI